MMISPVNNFKYSSLSFSGKKASNPKGDDENKKPKSSQNNAHEIYITPESYAALMGIGITEKMEERGMFDLESEFNKNIDRVAETLPEDEIDFDDEGLSDSIIDMAADSSIFSIKSTAELLGLIPDELKGKVPVFVDFSADDFIKSMEKSLEEQENIDYSAIQPDYDAVEESLAKMREEEREGALEILEGTMDLLGDEGFMNQMFSTQRGLIEKFKGDKKADLEDALKSLSEYTNYMFFRAINAGFNRDACTVVNTLCADMTSRTLPKVEDLGNGKTLNTYNEMFSQVEVIKDKATGDYVSAVMKKNGQEVCSVNFRKDGSIETLKYRNETDNSQIAMATNAKNTRVLVEQTSPGGICQRIFDKQANGELKQTHCQMKLFF